MPLFPTADVDYEFCRHAKLRPADLLIWLDLDDLLDQSELYIWSFFGRNLMIVDSAIRISCPHEEFDRWANSEAYWFDVSKRSDRREFVDWVVTEREKLKEKMGD